MDTAYTAPFLETIREHSALFDDSEGNKRVLTAAYDAIIRGDFPAFGELLTDDVELDIRGFAAVDGNWRGRQAVLEAARSNFGQVKEQKPKFEGLIVQGASAAVLIRERGFVKESGQSYHFRAVQWFTFAGGKIKRIDQLVAAVPGD